MNTDPQQLAPPEERDSLWWIAVSPIVWAVHFLATYLTAAIWCAKSARAEVSLTPVRIAIAAYTIAAVATIVWIGWWGYRQHSQITDKLPHDDDTPLDRHRFLGFATCLLSALSAVATLFVAAVAAFFSNCD